ncbi:MAG: MipA/OmpV family protein [Cytophagales bacterium]|nr:MipA/OmpV family protein [Rhizobacter sp.]
MAIASFKLVVASGVLAGVCSSAQAQGFDAVRLQGDAGSEGEGRAGVALIAGHKYLGSDERRYLLLPTIDYRWKNGWFAGMGNGVGYRFASNPQLQYGVRLAADFGRKEHRSDVLRGLGDIPARPEAGAFFNMHLSRELSLSSSLRFGAGQDRKGLLLDLGAHYGLQIAPQWRLGGSVSATYVNRDYMQDYFGVTPQQSARSGYAVYEPGAGVRDVRLGASLTHFFNRDWALTAALSATSLQGDAKRSVIVRESTPVTGVLALGYRF